MIQANKGSFGDAIGSITNVITSQICLQARFPKDSEEYKVLDYRILCGQMFQQNAIDKAKGIIAKPMPKYWYDNRYNRIDDDDSQDVIEKKLFNQRICADKKPYFFIYNYPTLMKEYKTYMDNCNSVCLMRYNMSLEEILSLENPTEEQMELIDYYKRDYPVNAETCIVNEICREIERQLADPKSIGQPFDPEILKSDVQYLPKERAAIEGLYAEFNKAVQEQFRKIYINEGFEQVINKGFQLECYSYVSDSKKLCNILIDLGYNKKKGKTFIWEIAGDIIIDNLLERSGGYIQIPVKDPSGEIEYCGENFTLKKIKYRGDDNGFDFE